MYESTPGYYSGSVNCPAGSDLTGGGTDWGGGSTYVDWQVHHSAPSPGGMGWEAGVYTKGAVARAPKVYAVCGTVD